MSLITVNGVVLPDPAQYQYSLNDVDSDKSGRSTINGKMHRDRIAQKTKIEVTWNTLSADNVKKIIQATNNQTLNVKFLNTYNNTYETKTMYVSSKTATMVDIRNGKVRYKGLKIDFIEI